MLERIKDILKPGGELIGKQIGNNPLVRTVSKEEAEKIIKHLMDAGANKATIQYVDYKGIWYELPGGQGGFGIRTKSSLKSAKYGTKYTVDLDALNLGIKKLKY